MLSLLVAVAAQLLSCQCLLLLLAVYVAASVADAVACWLVGRGGFVFHVKGSGVSVPLTMDKICHSRFVHKRLSQNMFGM